MNMEINILLIFIAAAGLAGFLLSSIYICEFLKRRNDKTRGFIYIALHLFKFGKKYASISRGERRKSGGLYFVMILSYIMMLFALVLIFVINVVIM